MRQLTFIRTVGAGAFGTVYQAELQSGRGFQRQVAVKIIQVGGPDGAMFLSRIRDEARLLGLLHDDAILKVLDMVQVDGRDAVVMEYVEGVDLDGIVRVEHPAPGRALAELGATVAGALHRAHVAVHPTDGSPLGVIHRDVKPANIMVTRSGGVRLLDFGVARARFEARESHTGQLMLGTLYYMAPEYIVANILSPAADVFGLGLCLFEAVTGQVYGQPKVRQDSHERRLEQNMELVRRTHPQLAPTLTQLLAWDPDARPDAGQAATLLWQVANSSTGPGLREWAGQVVPRVLAERGAADDALGLVGRTVAISTHAVVPETPPPADIPAPPDLPPDPADDGLAGRGLPRPAPAARPAPVARPAPADTPADRPVAPRTPDPLASASPEQPPPTIPTPAPGFASANPTPLPPPDLPAASPRAIPAPPAAGPDDPPPAQRSLVGDLVKGVLIGGIVGAVLLAVLVGILVASSR